MQSSKAGKEALNKENSVQWRNLSLVKAEMKRKKEKKQHIIRTKSDIKTGQLS